jgi:hypothetical protein
MLVFRSMPKADRPLEIRPYSALPGWDAYVEHHPKGTVFHSSSMIRAQSTTKRHHPYAMAAVNAGGQICALLVAIRVATLGKWSGPLAARSILYAEPICSDTPEGRTGLRQLIFEHDVYMRKRTLFAEVRPFFARIPEDDPLLEQGYSFAGYLNYELRINDSEENLFKRLHAKRRNNVRSSIRRGVVVEQVDPMAGLSDLYESVSESYASSKIPLVDRSLFESAFREFPGATCRILLAKYEQQVAAAACFLAYKNRVICWYAGAKRISGVAAMSRLFWEAIRQYASEGYQIFDFAGAGWEGEEYGPGKFKSKFGGELTNFGRYRKIYAPWKLQAASSAFETFRGWISPRVMAE